MGTVEKIVIARRTGVCYGVREAIDKVAADRTLLIIAHRLSTIEHVDRIVVMDKGRILEMGNHDELMARKGAYWNYVSLGERTKT